MSDISTLHNVVMGKRRLRRFFYAQVSEELETSDYVHGLDDVILAAAETLAHLDYEHIPQCEKRRTLANKMLETSPMLQKYQAEGRITAASLAEACHGILTSAICRLTTGEALSEVARKRRALESTNVTNIEPRVKEEDSDSDCILIDHHILQQRDDHEHEDSEGSDTATTQIDSPPEQQYPTTSEQHVSTVTCSLHLFSKLQASDRFASVAYAFNTTSSLCDVMNVLVDYGVVPSKDEISTMILLFKGFAVSIEHDKSFRSHLAAAHADQEPLVIFIEDRLNGSRESREELMARFISSSSRCA